MSEAAKNDNRQDPDDNGAQKAPSLPSPPSPSTVRWRLMHYAFEGGDRITSKPRAVLELDDTRGKVRNAISNEACQVEAFANCAREIIQQDFKLRSYEARIDWCDKGKWMEGTLTIEDGDDVVKAYGKGPTIMDAYIDALVRALNIIAP